MVIWYEKGYCKLRVKIFSVPTSKGKILKISWNSSPFTYFKMEVGTHNNGLHSWPTSYSGRLQCHLGNRESTYQISTFPSHP